MFLQMSSNETSIPWDDPFWLDEDESENPMKSELMKNVNEGEVESSQLEVIEEQAEASNISQFIEDNLKSIKENCTATVEPVNCEARDQGRPYHSHNSTDNYNQKNLPNRMNNYNGRNNYNRPNHHGYKSSNQGPRQNYRENSYYDNSDPSVPSHGSKGNNNNKNYRNRNNNQRSQQYENYRNRQSNNEERYSRPIATNSSEIIEIRQDISEKEIEVPIIEKEEKETPIPEQVIIEEPVCPNSLVDESPSEERDSENMIEKADLDVEDNEKDIKLVVDNEVVVEASNDQPEPLCENKDDGIQSNEEDKETKNDTPKRPPMAIYNVNSVKGKWSNLFNGTEGSTLKLSEQKSPGRQLPKQTNDKDKSSRKPNYKGSEEQVSNRNRFNADRDSKREVNDQSNSLNPNFHGNNRSAKQEYKSNKNDLQSRNPLTVDGTESLPNNAESIVSDKNRVVEPILPRDCDRNANPVSECNRSPEFGNKRANVHSKKPFNERNRGHQKEKFNKADNEHRQWPNETGNSRNNDSRTNRFDRGNSSEYEARKLPAERDYNSKNDSENDLKLHQKGRDHFVNEERIDEANLSHKNNKNWKEDPRDRDNRVNQDPRRFQYNRNNRPNNDLRKYLNETYNAENNNSRRPSHEKVYTPTNEFAENNQHRRENTGTNDPRDNYGGRNNMPNNDTRGHAGQRFNRNHNDGKGFQAGSDIVQELPVKINNVPEHRNADFHDSNINDDYKRFQERRNKTDTKGTNEKRNDNAERNKHHYNNTQGQRHHRTHENDHRRQEDRYNPDNNEPRKPGTMRNNTGNYDRESPEIRNEPQRPANTNGNNTNAATNKASNGDTVVRDNFRSDSFRGSNRNNRNHQNRTTDCSDNDRRDSQRETEHPTSNHDNSRPPQNPFPPKTFNYSFMSNSKFVNDNHNKNPKPNR